MKYLKVLFCLFCFLALSQNETANWFFGYHAGLRFLLDESVTNLSGGQIATNGSTVAVIEGCSTISDANGQLLFYTDGRSVWDKNHLPMPGGSLAFGTRLHGHFSSTQSALIVPHPTQTNLYYIFTTDEPNPSNASYYPGPNPFWSYEGDDGFNNGLNYSIVDISVTGSNGSMGDVIQRNIHLVTYNPDPNGLEIRYKCSEKLAGIKNIDDNSYWVVTHFINKYFAFKITGSGVNHIPVISTIGLNNPIENMYFDGGQLKFNLEGNKIAAAHKEIGNGDLIGKVELFDFNLNNGSITNLKLVAENASFYGLEFSPNGRFLYVVFWILGDTSIVRQYDLLASNIPLNYVVLPIPVIGQLQLANNGKIYCSSENESHLHVINNPNAIGLACDAVLNGQALLSGSKSAIGLPNFVANLIIPPLNIQNFCLGTPTVFGFNNFQSATNILWQFGDGNSSTLANPSHTYTLPGTYQVSLSYSSNGQTQNFSRQITIHPAPVAHALGEQKLCLNSQQASINLKSLYDAAILNGQSATQHQVLYYANQTAFNNNNPISQPENFSVAANQTYQLFAKVINVQDSNCSAQTNFSLQTFLKPVIQNQPAVFVCQQPYTGQHVFQLNDYNGQLTANNPLIAVSYYASQQDAEQQNNALPLSYTNTLPEETIFYRLHHIQNTACFSVGSFQLIVNPQPEAITPFNWYVCDNDSDGITMVNFNDQQNTLLNGMDPARYSLSYYISLHDAQNMTNAINANFTNTQTQTLVYYRLHNNLNNQCMAVGQFTLIVTPHTQVAQPPTQYFCVTDTSQALSFQLEDFYTLLLPNANQNDYTFSFHPTLQDAQNQTLAFVNPYQNSLPQETWHVRVQHLDNPLCVYFTTLNIDIQTAAIAHAVLPLATCDDDNQTGVSSFNLANRIPDILQNQSPNQYQVRFYFSQHEAEQAINPLPLTYANISNPQTIYARVNNVNTTDCFDITPLQLIVYPKPYTNQVMDESMCDGVPKRLEVPAGFASYTWSTGATNRWIMVNSAGQYWVDVVQNYPHGSCSGRLNFNVVASGLATIERIEKIEFQGGKNQMSIFVSGLGDYDYSLDGVNYQDSSVFSNLIGGVYTVYVRDKNDCGVVSQLVYLLDAPLFFTPNGDGYNDTWHITSAHLEPNMMIYIYDRFGKLIKTLKPTEAGWNGTYNNQQLPASDYWYVVQRPDKPLVKGHFSLKR